MLSRPCSSSTYTREIKSINFGILSTEDVIINSVCQVVNTKLSGAGSVYDERMGPSLDVTKSCVTCGNGPDVCPGHFGHIVLNQPIIHPLFYKYVVSFLRCFCDECHKLIVPEDFMSLYRLDKMSVQTRFDAVLKVAEKIDACWNCGKIQAKICLIPADNSIVKTHKVSTTTAMAAAAADDDEHAAGSSAAQTGSKVMSVPMTVDEISKIFDGISDSDVRLLGFNPQFNHPRNMILHVFPVIPSCSRPFIVSDGNICDDDLTNQICEIVKANNALCNEASDIKFQKALQSLKFRIHTFYDNSKGRSKHTTSGRPIKGIKERLVAKDGQLRGNLLGKRCDQSARTVIGPDPSLRMDEVGVPIEICENLTIPEVVNAYNLKRLTELVNSNGAKLVVKGGKNINLAYATFKKATELLYGDTVVLAKSGNHLKINDKNYTYTLQPGDKIIRNGVQLDGVRCAERKRFNLEIGNVVHRKLMDGDWILLNRQPTLHKGSMMAVKVVRLPGKSIRFNTEKCSSYNADFDGDEMNLHVPASYEAMIELETLSSVKENIITPQSSKPNIVIIQDSLLGAYKMTLGWKTVREDIFYQVLSFLPSNYVLNKIQHIRRVMIKLGFKPMALTGKGLMSVLLPDDFYYHQKGRNDNQEDVKIHEGVLYSGAFTKDQLGSSHNSLILLLNKEYGADVVMNFINNVQFLVNGWLLYAGFTVSIGDCIATTKTQIEDTIQKCYIEAKQIEEQTRNPYVRELKINACLSKAKDIGMRIAKEALAPDNNFVTTVTSGSKGDYFNIAQLTGLLGQQNLDGKRISKMLNRGKRSLPHYILDEPLSPAEEFESRGFISNSFIHGLNPIECFMHAITGRQGVTDTAMGTAKSGYIQRKIVKCMEDLSTEYDNTVRDTTGALYQYSYGQTGYDPTKLVKTASGEMDCCNISRLVNRLNKKYE